MKYHINFPLPLGPQTFEVKSPVPEVIFDRYMDTRQAGGISAANTVLCKGTITSHTGSELDRIFEQYPATKHSLAVAIQRDAGAAYDILEGEAVSSSAAP